MSQNEQGARVGKDSPGDTGRGAENVFRGDKDLPAESVAAPARRVDRRVRRSRRAIIEAFDRLIMDEPIDQITVSLIAREADVDRKTFYQHFGSIDGLLDAIAEDVVTELLDKVESVAQASPGGSDQRPLRTFFAALTEHLSKNLLLGQRYCEHVPSELLLEHLARPLVRQCVDRGFVSEDIPDDELEMLLAYGLGGLFSLYRWWLLSDRVLTIAEVTQLACQLVESGVSSFVKEGERALR